MQSLRGSVHCIIFSLLVLDVVILSLVAVVVVVLGTTVAMAAFVPLLPSCPTRAAVTKANSAMIMKIISLMNMLYTSHGDGM